MLRSIVATAAVCFAVACLAAPAQASDTCQRYTGGKCKAGQKAPSGISKGAVTHQKTQPPATGNHKGRDEYTAAQREKYMEDARQICRNKFGPTSVVYRIDYKFNRIWCTPASY